MRLDCSEPSLGETSPDRGMSVKPERLPYFTAVLVRGSDIDHAPAVFNEPVSNGPPVFQSLGHTF
jgi:hypothetical protein